MVNCAGNFSGNRKRRETGFKRLGLALPTPAATAAIAAAAAALLSLMQELQQRRPNQLDRGHFYSKLQHLIKGLACQCP